MTYFRAKGEKMRSQERSRLPLWIATYVNKRSSSFRIIGLSSASRTESFGDFVSACDVAASTAWGAPTCAMVGEWDVDVRQFWIKHKVNYTAHASCGYAHSTHAFKRSQCLKRYGNIIIIHTCTHTHTRTHEHSHTHLRRARMRNGRRVKYRCGAVLNV